jgi:hypothetical protein
MYKGITDTHSGTFFGKQGNQITPVYESTEEKFRREFPEGTIYKRFLARLPTVKKKASIYPSPSF